MLTQKNWMLFSIQFRAENETRTRDPNLGKVVLYQLSYFRSMCPLKWDCKGTDIFLFCKLFCIYFQNLFYFCCIVYY